MPNNLLSISRISLTVLVALAAILTSFYEFRLKETLKILGNGRIIQSVGNGKCTAIHGVEACEKLSIHSPTGLVYLACSTPEARTHWLPTNNRLNSTGKSMRDYVAIFDPKTGTVRKLETTGFNYTRGLSVHGMDIQTVPSASQSSRAGSEELLIYLINHRAPLPPKEATRDGQDSSVEVFRTRPGDRTIHYVKTFEDVVIASPNDVVAGDPKDAPSFYFTNDHGFVKGGLARRLNLDTWLGLKWSNVGFCHHKRGCKVASTDTYGANGITKDNTGCIFVGSSRAGRIYVLKRETDDGLTRTDVIPVDRAIDNLSVDDTGAVVACGLPKPAHLRNVHVPNPTIRTPSSGLRITMHNDGGKDDTSTSQRFEVKKIFEDDGTIASGSTSVAYDAQRKKLYTHGISAPYLTVCDIDLATEG